MLPGKRYTPEDVLFILRRRIWLILVPFAVVSAMTAVVARKLPDKFRAETVILVVPQRVPESYVRATVTTRIEDRLQSITQQILSRTRLERIIGDLNLYVEERRTGNMEDVIERMRRDISAQVVRGDAFRVSYVGDDARTVMRVADRLASLFIEENLRDREVLAEGTTQFLEAQLEDARRRLIDHEKKLETYRRQYSGELPSQMNSNLQALQNLQLQIQSVTESVNRDRDRRLGLEAQITDLERELDVAETAAVEAPTLATPQRNAPPGGAQQQLIEARGALTALELRLKANHPDVQRMRRVIRELEQKADAEALDVPIPTEQGPAPASPADATRRRRLEGLHAELAQLDRQIAAKETEERRLREQVANYQQNVEMIPTRESEMTELTRDYATLQSMYTNLLAKKEDARIAANLERRQIGEQFRLLDPARLPEKPFSPNRQQINFVGMAGGLALGLALVAFLEYRDRSFKTDEEVRTLLTLPVLAVVPLMHSDADRRRLFWRRLVLHGGLGAMVTGCLALVIYTFIR